jgi:glycosyltransferase involved in cell wall biosynthesis
MYAEMADNTRPNRRIRLLLFTNSVFIGGLERHVELLARHLDRSRFEVFSITPGWPRTVDFDLAMQRLSEHHASISPDRRWGLAREVRGLFRLYRQLKQWQVDVMHMHLTAYRGGLLSLIIARLAGVPTVVCTEHLAPEEKRPLPRWLLRYLFVHLLDRLICVSEKNREERAKYLYTPRDRTSVVTNGIDPDDFPPRDPSELAQLRRELAIPDQAPIVGSVVRFEPEKGLDYLLDAMPAVLQAHPETYLLLVGDGTVREQLEAQSVRLGIRERVIFAGFHPDPRPYLGLIDVFVLPVPIGSMSIGLLEAMAMRRAVVITFGSPGEAVVHEESGLWAPPRDPAGLASAIKRLIASPELRHAYGIAARRRVEQGFSAASVARQLSDLYRVSSVGHYFSRKSSSHMVPDDQ